MLSLSWRLLLRLPVFCAVLCIVIPAAAARSPKPTAAWEQFGFAACALPCFAGITPAETAFSEVSRLLLRHVPALDPRMMHSGSSVNFQANATGLQAARMTLSGLVRYDRGTAVSELRLNTALPLELLVAALGAPDCILPSRVTNTNPSTVIFWERDAVSIAAVLPRRDATLHLNAEISALWLRAVNPPDCAMRGTFRWKGFAPLWAYNSARGG